MSVFGEFYWDEHQGRRYPAGRPREERFLNLALLVTTDIYTDHSSALEALQLVEEARAGRDDLPEWLGDSTSAYFRPSGVTITDLGPDPQPQHYTLDEVHETLVQYWVFLCPTAEERRASLQEWADFYAKNDPNPRHPCLDHLPL